VRTIRRITKTMQMIATAKFTASLSRAKASRPYMERIRELVAEVAARAGDVSHPLCQPPQKAAKKELILVVASDRGLCGAYNGHVLRTAMKAIRAAREAGLAWLASALALLPDAAAGGADGGFGLKFAELEGLRQRGETTLGGGQVEARADDVGLDLGLDGLGGFFNRTLLGHDKRCEE
jgi:hypothetical protein